MMHATVAGHLGDDVEERVTPSGQKVATFRMAVNVRKSGKEETVWWTITMWDDRFSRILPYLKKGSGVIVTGRMSPPRLYPDRTGNTRVAMEMTAELIEFSPFGKSTNKQQETSSSTYSGFSQQVVAEPGTTDEFNAFGQPHAGASKTFGQESASFSEFDEEPIPF